MSNRVSIVRTEKKVPYLDDDDLTFFSFVFSQLLKSHPKYNWVIMKGFVL